MKNLLKALLISISVWALIIILIVGALLLTKPKQYATSDINNYGNYIGNGDNQFASKYISAFFPEIIESSFTDVTYSYRAQNLGNYAFEAYLEFVIEDEKAFHEFVSAKTSGLECKEFPYDPNFVEYTLDAMLDISVIDGEDDQNRKILIHNARIGKILCNAEEHRFIFVAIAMRDAWDAYSDYFCCYFDRFNIDPTKYEGMIIR